MKKALALILALALSLSLVRLLPGRSTRRLPQRWRGWHAGCGRSVRRQRKRRVLHGQFPVRHRLLEALL